MGRTGNAPGGRPLDTWGAAANGQQQQTEQQQQQQQQQEQHLEQEQEQQLKAQQRHLQADGSRALLKRPPTFGEQLAYCRLHGASDVPTDWVKAVNSLRPLVASVRGPQQAQQVWEVACSLSMHPLPPKAAKLLAHFAVNLVNLSLDKGDYSILHNLLVQRHSLAFDFGMKSVEALLRGALAADVELGELQGILRLVPHGRLSNRAFFSLVKTFEGRGQVAEALHCYQHMQVLGLRQTPSLEAAHKRLRDGRAASSRQSIAHR